MKHSQPFSFTFQTAALTPLYTEYQFQEVNVQPGTGINNLLQNPVLFPHVRRRFMIPDRERRSASPPLAARRTRASQRRASAQRILERRASVQRLYARRNLNQQTASAHRTNAQRNSARRLNAQRYSARHLSSLQRRRRALSANQASRISDAPSNLDQSFTSGSTAIAISTGANMTPASAMVASAHTPLNPPPLPATPPPSVPVQARIAPTQLRLTGAHVLPVLHSRSRPLVRTIIRWRNPQNHDSSSSPTSVEPASTLLTADTAFARPGSTPFRSLMRPLPNRSAAPPAETRRINSNNSPLTTITSRLGTGSDTSFNTSESDTDTAHSVSGTLQTPPAIIGSMPSSGIRTANLDSRQNRTRVAIDSANILNPLSSSETSETGSTQVSTSSTQ